MEKKVRGYMAHPPALELINEGLAVGFGFLIGGVSFEGLGCRDFVLGKRALWGKPKRGSDQAGESKEGVKVVNFGCFHDYF